MTDSSDAVVGDSRVELKDNAKGTLHVASTDAEGRYIFSFLRPGSYTITVTKQGFVPVTRRLDVFLGPPSTLNVMLVIATGTMEITVSAERPLIQAENGDESSTIEQRQIAALPNGGNDLTYIAQTTPGTVMNTDGGLGNFSSMGMPGVSNQFTLNGMNDKAMGPDVNLSGALNLLLGENEIQEATVVTNGYSGQFGDVAGANVNYITKSGGNRFHGNAIYGWNGRILNANSWFNNAFGNSRPFDNVNQWAASFGGPIKKQKLFFFFNTEGVRLLLPQSGPVAIPSAQFEAATLANIDARFGPSSASDAFYGKIFDLYNATPGASAATPGFLGADPLGCAGFVGPNGLGTTVPCAIHFLANLGRPTDESLVSGRVDWNIRTADRAFLLVQYDHGRQAVYTDPISPLFNVDSDQPWWQGQLNETHTFGSNTANQLLVAAQVLDATFSPPNLAQALAAFPTVLSWGAIGTFADLGGQDNIVPQENYLAQLQVSDDVAEIWGNHKLGFGGNLVHEDRRSLGLANLIGRLAPQTLTAFYQGGVDPGFLDGSDPNPDFTVLRQTFAQQGSRSFTLSEVALYAQDEWHARPDFSITLGLRVEHQSNPSCSQGCFARLAGPFDSISHDPGIGYNQVILTHQRHAFTSLEKVLWAPRFSFAWQPLGVSHNTVIRGGFGTFYDFVPVFIENSFANNPPLRNLFTAIGDNLAPSETSSLFKDTAASNAGFLRTFANGETLDQIQAEVPNFHPPAINNPGRRTHAAQYQKWSLAVQQTVGTGTSVGLGYYGNHGIHEFIRDTSVNAFGFGSLPPGLCTSPPVPPCADPRFSQVTEITTVGVSNYNALIASVQQRFKEGVLRANYTWSHAFDEVSNDGIGSFTFSSDPQPQDARNPRGSYGPADYDVRHSLNVSYVWEVPFKTALRGHGPKPFLNGWQIAGTVFARTGFPYTVLDFFQSGNLQANNFFGPIYAVPGAPLTTAGRPCGEAAAIPSATKPCLPPEALPDGTPNPGALFVQPGCETGFNTGNLPSATDPCGGPSVTFAQGRNRFRGPHYFNADLSVTKNTKLPRWEGATLGVGVQFFNLFNHPNFGLPDAGLPSPTFGDFVYLEAPPTSLLGSGLGGDVSARMIELKLQVQF